MCMCVRTPVCARVRALYSELPPSFRAAHYQGWQRISLPFTILTLSDSRGNFQPRIHSFIYMDLKEKKKKPLSTFTTWRHLFWTSCSGCVALAVNWVIFLVVDTLRSLLSWAFISVFSICLWSPFLRIDSLLVLQLVGLARVDSTLCSLNKSLLNSFCKLDVL